MSGQGLFAEAEELYREGALTIRENLGAQSKTSFFANWFLSKCLLAQGKHAEATALYVELESQSINLFPLNGNVPDPKIEKLKAEMHSELMNCLAAQGTLPS